MARLMIRPTANPLEDPMGTHKTSLTGALTGFAVCCTLSACSSQPGWSHLGGAPVAEAGVYEAVVRYLHAYYDPPDWNPAPAAWCLATGRRASSVARGRVGEDRSAWAPTPRLVSSLNDLRPPVRRIDECATDDGDERLLATGERAIVVAIEHPAWESPEFARLLVYTRQDTRANNRFSCRVSRTTEGWRVQECI